MARKIATGAELGARTAVSNLSSSPLAMRGAMLGGQTAGRNINPLFQNQFGLSEDQLVALHKSVTGSNININSTVPIIDRIIAAAVQDRKNVPELNFYGSALDTQDVVDYFNNNRTLTPQAVQRASAPATQVSVAPFVSPIQSRSETVTFAADPVTGQATESPLQTTGSTPVSQPGAVSQDFGAVQAGVQQPAAFGDVAFATGDPQLDDFLNNTYLPLLEAEFSGDPTAVLNPEVFNRISERIGKTFGPIFEASKQRITEDFELQQSGIDLQRRQQTQGFTEQEQDIGTARTRLGEDVGAARTREVRNYQTAVQESAAAFASAGRAFGGGRMETERRLGEESQERLSDIQKQEQRRLEDLKSQEQSLGAQRGFAGESFGLQGRQLELGRGRQEQELVGERTLMEAGERQRLRQLGGSLLQNPEFLPQRQLT